MINYKVTSDDAGKYLREIIQVNMDVSRHLLAKLKNTHDGILVNGERKTVRYQVQAGDQVVLNVDDATPATSIFPEERALHIIYEDKNTLVINKKPGQIMYPRYRGEEGSLAAAVLYYLKHTGHGETFHPVTRLDKGTSGLVLLAKNKYAAAKLQESVCNKWYLAAVFGCLLETGEIRMELKKRDVPVRGVGAMCISSDGKKAFTSYKGLWYDEQRQISGIKLDLHTGRRHQIRLHMSHLGHPLIGDVLYGGPAVSCGHPLLWSTGFRFQKVEGGSWIDLTHYPNGQDELAWMYPLFEAKV